MIDVLEVSGHLTVERDRRPTLILEGGVCSLLLSCHDLLCVGEASLDSVAHREGSDLQRSEVVP
jgi:hypothetical protein